MAYPHSSSITARSDNTTPLRDLGIFASRRQSDLTSRFLAAQAFANRRRYGLFLKAQYRIGAELGCIYDHPLHHHLLPALGATSHLTKVTQDIRDLGLDAPHHSIVPDQTEDLSSFATLCGGLFIAEGLRLMFPWFRKQAAGLGFDTSFGARHLAADPAMIRRRWKGFVEAVNAMSFSGADMLAMAMASERCMERIRTVLDEELGEAQGYARMMEPGSPCLFRQPPRRPAP